MASNFSVIFILALATSSCLGGVFPAVPAAYSIPYASSYNAHIINHAVAAPLAAAPLIAAPAPVAFAAHGPVAAAAPLAYNAIYGK